MLIFSERYTHNFNGDSRKTLPRIAIVHPPGRLLDNPVCTPYDLRHAKDDYAVAEALMGGAEEMSRKLFLRIALNIIMPILFVSIFIGCSINKGDLIGKWTGVIVFNAKIVDKWVVQFEFFNNGTVQEVLDKYMTDNTISRQIFSGKYSWENNNRIKISWDPPKLDPMRKNYVVKFKDKNTLILENVDYEFDKIEYKRVQ